LSGLARLVTGRRTKWLVVLVWVALAAVFAAVGSKLTDVTDDRTQSFLPSEAESTEVLRTVNREFPGGQTRGGLIVYEREGGLTAEDRAKIVADAEAAATSPDIELVGKPLVPFQGAPPESVSEDESLAYTTVAVPDDNKRLSDWGKELRAITDESGPAGLKVYVTGDLGFSTDFEEVFGSVDSRLLIATVLLVLVLLGAIYRAPLIVLIPLVVVGLAYMVTTGLVYLFAEAGNTVSQQSTSILVVLLFGVGTDYCLLLVSRYREELRHLEDKHAAMQRALERAGPAIVASGMTVAIALLVLLVADSQSTKSLGPVAAIGVACALLAGVTLLPALLTIAGRAGFWPRREIVRYDPNHEYTERRSTWRRFGDGVVGRPALAFGVTALLMLAGALGILAYKEDYSTTGFFKKKTETVDGFRAIQGAFPDGALSPTTVLVSKDGGPVTEADVAAVQDRLDGAPKLAEVSDAQFSPDRSHARFAVVFKDDPLTDTALARVPDLRERVSSAPGLTVLVGNGSATSYDYNQATERDLTLIVPLALAVIAVILGLLLRAIVAPIVLILTVILSFLATLGLSLLFIRYVVGDAGVDNSLPTYAFIFLVALGTDYTIFLMSRVREEARQHGTRQGVLIALGATGPVITSAGLILAGTFTVLMTLPVTFAFNIGFVVALGILLDTFVVRTIMVPALVELIGDRIWWPSTASGGGGALRERTDPEGEPAGEVRTAQ
jgi:RND superfamily putative drug exporter